MSCPEVCKNVIGDVEIIDENEICFFEISVIKKHFSTIYTYIEDCPNLKIVDMNQLGDIENIDWDFVLEPSNFEGMQESFKDDEEYISLKSNEDFEYEFYDEVNKEFGENTFFDCFSTSLISLKDMHLSIEDSNEYVNTELRNLGFTRMTEPLTKEEQIEFMKI